MKKLLTSLAVLCAVSTSFSQEHALEEFPISRVEAWNNGLLVMGHGEDNLKIKNEFVFIDSAGNRGWRELLNLTAEETFFLSSPETQLCYFVEDMEEQLVLSFTQVYATGYNKKKSINLVAPIRQFRTDVDFSNIKLLEMHAAYYNLVMLFEYENKAEGAFEYFTILMSHNSFKLKTVKLLAAYTLDKESKKQERSRPTFLGTVNGKHCFGQWSNQERFSGQRIYTVTYKGEDPEQISFQWDESFYPGVSEDMSRTNWNSYYGTSGDEREYDASRLDNWGGMKIIGNDVFVYGVKMQSRPGEKKNMSTGSFVVRYNLNGSKIWSKTLDVNSGMTEAQVGSQSLVFSKQDGDLFLSIGESELSTVKLSYESGEKLSSSQAKVSPDEAKNSILAPAMASKGKPISGGNLAEMDGKVVTYTYNEKVITINEL